jgi:hypothetical protein
MRAGRIGEAGSTSSEKETRGGIVPDDDPSRRHKTRYLDWRKRSSLPMKKS